jgi:hypothetical protein
LGQRSESPGGCDAIDADGCEIAGDDFIAFEMDVKVSFASAVVEMSIGRSLSLDQKLNGLTNEGLAELKAEFGGDLVKGFDTLIDDRAADEVVAPACGRGARARGKGESVNVNEAGLPGDVDGLLKIFVGFAGESGNDVGGEGRAVECGIKRIKQPKVIAAGILAIHFAKDGVGAALQGKMKMGNDLGMGAENGEEFGVHVAGLETGEPKPAKAGNAGAK